MRFSACMQLCWRVVGKSKFATGSWQRIDRDCELRLFEARHRGLPGKVREAAAQVKFCMAVFFDYAASVILVW